MAVLKCKMCGGDLNITEAIKVCECEYCGTKQTIPSIDDEKELNLFVRANRLRAACEFDKAASVYESIVADFPEEAEAYWGLVLCKFGIEYVDDPTTAKKVPTCHRSSFESIFEDSDFKMVMEYSDVITRVIYRQEAKVIEDIRARIIELSAKEKPYDIFICYKETDHNGNRTIDSVLAQDIYDALVEKGYKVFFSRITLEDKLGQEYEPYIFAALNSSKVMLVVGTDYEYFNAVWVKNEWSRFLSLIEKGHKKHLIPCYRDIDAYDMPTEFKRLQAQDLGKIGAIQDLLRGISKLINIGASAEEKVPDKKKNDNALITRMFMFLEDGDWAKADAYCEKILDQEPENGSAYLGKLMVEFRLRKLEDFTKCSAPFEKSNNYQKVLRYGDSKIVEYLKKCVAYVEESIRRQQYETMYKKAVRIWENSHNDVELANAVEIFKKIRFYKNSEQYINNVDKAITERAYKDAIAMMDSNSRFYLESALSRFEKIPDYKDSREKIAECKNRISKLEIKKTNDMIVTRKQIEEKMSFEQKVGIVSGGLIILLLILFCLV